MIKEAWRRVKYAVGTLIYGMPYIQDNGGVGSFSTPILESMDVYRVGVRIRPGCTDARVNGNYFVAPMCPFPCVDCVSPGSLPLGIRH